MSMIRHFALKTLPLAVLSAWVVLHDIPAFAQQAAHSIPSGTPVEQPALTNTEGFSTAGEPTQPNPLRDSVVIGLENNPTLSAELSGLSAQIEEANVKFGGLLPTVDLRGSTGREKTKIDTVGSRTYNANSYGIEARQNIFNGFASQSRYLASYADAMQSYYRYLNKANQVAFEASSAHIDVSRAQALVKLAERNLKVHQDLMNKIDEKVKSGVARESDLEQARSRYTLALSNLATEKANAFTAMSNYQRITDRVWPINDEGQYVLQANFEVDNIERLVFALNTHPLLRAANAAIEASKQAVTAASEGFYPRIDLRAKSDVYSNYLSTFDERQISSVDVLASMNLYRGGADSASRNAAIHRKMRALDDKLVTCRAIRQNSQNALFDVNSLQRKQNYLRAQTDAIAKARAAYEQQFAVGRRSLLDLLSAENEYYQAHRGLINIDADLSVAKLRLLSATGQLIGLFGVDDLVKAGEPVKRQVILYKEQSQSGAESEGCPAELINIQGFQMPAIGFDDAFKKVGNDQPSSVPQPLVQQDAAPGVLPTLPVSMTAQAPQKPAESVDPATVSKNLISRTSEWLKAWQNKDVNAYIAFYAPTFKPEQGNYESWEVNRRERLRSAAKIEIDMTDVQVVPNFDDPTVYELTFTQNYRSNNYQEKSKKTLTWKQQGGQWQIVRERNEPLTGTSAKAPGPVQKTSKMTQL
ncbi:TolC family outer membrane protein [Limnobacter humi]|uniref:TolC family outer membrane protein n=1 Tax=Limnobacter humi TaxID=1778671 RepID=A0ABT1WEI1_9BURK|nr:TolC family outer membrane protein [Limnobacter humi]MCQ8895895.1 TolC family outer membrane protein [Limnobacter humi]